MATKWPNYNEAVCIPNACSFLSKMTWKLSKNQRRIESYDIFWVFMAMFFGHEERCSQILCVIIELHYRNKFIDFSIDMILYQGC
jgi:hypothetical protein